MLNGIILFHQEDVHHTIVIEKTILGKIINRYYCLIYRRHISCYLFITVFDIKCFTNLTFLHVSALRFLTVVEIIKIILINDKFSIVHSSTSTHCLPNLTKIFKIMSNYNRCRNQRFFKLISINKLKWNVFSNHITIIYKVKYFFIAQVLVLFS